MSDAADNSEVPEGWASVALGQLVQPSTKKVEPAECPDAPYLSLEHIESGTGQILGRGVGLDAASTKAVFRAGDVLFGKLRPYLNKVCVPDFDGICSTDILVFEQTATIGSSLLRHYLSLPKIVAYANHHSSGVQLPRVSFKTLAELFVPLPPLAEQRRIVELVEAMLRRVQVARQRLARVPLLLKRFRQAVLTAACKGQLTADWRSGEKLDVSRGGIRSAEVLCELSDLPDSWGCARAADIVEPGTVISYGIVLPGPNLTEGVPYIRGQDIDDKGCIHVDQLWRTSPDIAAKHRRSELKEGDVLLCVIRHLRVAIVPAGLNGANLTQGTVRLRPSKGVNARFLASYLNSPIAQSWMKQRYIGMAMPRINVGHAREIPVPLPPLAEQLEIVRRISALFSLADAIERRVAAATARADKLTQAILAKAFRGELVPTEAELARAEGRDYETAAALLDRVAASREQSIARPTKQTTRHVAKTARAKK